MGACGPAISAPCRSEMRWQASSPASASRPSHTSNRSCTLSRVSLAARAPRLGSSTTRPSAASTFRASRKGVREMPSASHSSRSGTRAPGGISPSTSLWRSRATTSSCIVRLGVKFCIQTIAASAVDRQKEIAITAFCIQNNEISPLTVTRRRRVTIASVSPQAAETDLLYEVRDGIGRITFNRPQARNAFTFAMYERLAAICEAAPSDRALKVLVLKGQGDKAFASGTDINQFRAFKTPEDALAYESRTDRILGAPEPEPAPPLPATRGHCTGGGAGIAACCALRGATPPAKFGF